MDVVLTFYEIISCSGIAFAALFLIIPGFLTDLIGFLLILPPTRKILIFPVSSKFKKKQTDNEGDVIEGKIDDNQDDKNN